MVWFARLKLAYSRLAVVADERGKNEGNYTESLEQARIKCGVASPVNDSICEQDTKFKFYQKQQKVSK